jgi:hypothetical protein
LRMRKEKQKFDAQKKVERCASTIVSMEEE